MNPEFVRPFCGIDSFILVHVLSRYLGHPQQIIHPWMFGEAETKATCLWLKNLPKLEPTSVVYGRKHSIHSMAPSSTRSKERSRTFQGIADAMAEQWGPLLDD